MVRPVQAPSQILLDWFDHHQRQFPWRAIPGEIMDPYWVWLSEIMLQQTTTITVRGYFEDFVSRWPSIEDLAAAELDAVLHAWQGLGYYARARNLHKCAKLITKEYGGKFPETEEALIKLPGIGPYTAAAIAAIAFGHIATPVDGNVERVTARLHRISKPLPGAKKYLKEKAAELTPSERSGDYAQAVMDLGATICTPRKPNCPLCPWSYICKAYLAGDAEKFPKRVPKKRKPTRYASVYWLLNGRGNVLLRRREEKGLLGGMMEFPSTDWLEEKIPTKETFNFAPAAADWQMLSGKVRHTFTHFHLELKVLKGIAEEEMVTDGVWCEIDKLDNYALPTLMKKVCAHAAAQSPGILKPGY